MTPHLKICSLKIPGYGSSFFKSIVPYNTKNGSIKVHSENANCMTCKNMLQSEYFVHRVHGTEPPKTFKITQKLTCLSLNVIYKVNYLLLKIEINNEIELLNVSADLWKLLRSLYRIHFKQKRGWSKN